MSFMEIAQLLGNLGEFVGAFAVVATLFYLALQVRHSKEATEANTRSMEETRKVALLQSMVTTREGWQNFAGWIAGSSEMADIWLRGNAGEELSPVDAERYGYIAQELYYLEAQGFGNSVRFSDDIGAGDWTIYQLAGFVDGKPGLQNVIFELIRQRGDGDAFTQRIRELNLPELAGVFSLQ